MAAKQAEQTKPELLIVDDDPLITDTLNFVLSRDFTVYVADSRARVVRRQGRGEGEPQQRMEAGPHDEEGQRAARLSEPPPAGGAGRSRSRLGSS